MSLYDEILNNVKSGNTVNAKQHATANLATEKTRNYYTKVCGQKNISPIENYDKLDQNTLSNEIKRVQALPNFAPATTSQINKLQSLFESCKMTEPDLSGLSISSASEMIGKLKTIYEEKYAHIPTPKQLAFIEKMIICPTVGKSDLAGTPTTLLDERDTIQQDIVTHNEMAKTIFSMYQKAIMNTDIDKTTELEQTSKQVEEETLELEQQYLKLTNEIVEYESNLDLEKITKEEASNFINKYQATYFAWEHDRASEGQRDLINQLLKRNGEEELTHEQLMQFDKKLASDFLNSLQAEIGRGKKASPIEEEIFDIRLPKTLAEAEEAFQGVLTNVIYSLCASMGDTAEDNPILTTSNFQEEFKDLLKMVNVYVSKENIVDMVASVLPEDDVYKILGIAK